MLQPGLVSVTFKHKSCEEVIRYAQGARLRAIEWHGENHVRHGDLQTARRVKQYTLDAGLAVAAYGSYYVAGESEANGLPFETVLQTAEALGAPMIRIWAGNQEPDDTPSRARAHILQEIKRVTDLAAEKHIRVVLEFHKGTLTLTGLSTVDLLTELDHPNIRSYWQPVSGKDVNWNLDQLRLVLPWLGGLHVFHWGPTDLDRHTLAQGKPDWVRYLATANQGESTLNAMLEFVKNDSVTQFNEDAATLHELLA